MKSTLIISLLAISLIALPVKAETWMDAHIDSLMQEMYALGLSAKIVQNGEIIWSGDYGWSRIGMNIPVTDMTVFGTGSVSKTCAAIALMQLWEDGFFQLDDNINDYLPFTVVNPLHPGSTITIYMLMTHTSSIDDNWSVMESVINWSWDSPIPLRDFLEGYFVPGGAYYSPVNYLNVIPGSYHNYTNVGCCLAGYLVEAITGIEYDQYCRDSIFVPLGMNQTSHFYAQLDTSNVAMPYHFVGGSYVPYGYYNAPWTPSSSLKTSSLQLSNYLMAIMQYGQLGGVRILDSTTVVEMLTAYEAITDTGAQGLFWLNYRTPTLGLWTWGHSGGWYGVVANMWFCPDENFGYVVMSNADYWQAASIFYYPLCREFWNFAASYIPLTCTMTPLNPPIVIPTSGGSFEFTVDIENPTDSTAVFDFWTDMTMPSGEMSETLILLEDLNLAAYGSYSDQMTQEVADSLPDGEYSYNCYVGDYPRYAWNQGSFPFTKEGAYVEGETHVPSSFALHPPYPNPFNPVTTLSFSIPVGASVNLKIYDVMGRHVATLIDGWRDMGTYHPLFDASDLASGIYFYRLETATSSKTRKMVLLK